MTVPDRPTAFQASPRAPYLLVPAERLPLTLVLLLLLLGAVALAMALELIAAALLPSLEGL